MTEEEGYRVADDVVDRLKQHGDPWRLSEELPPPQKRALDAVNLLMRTRHLNWLLTVAILLIGTAPLYAQRQQPDLAKLKADAQKLVSIISGDKAKIEAYCEATDIGQQIVEAAQDNNEKKAAALMQRIDELEKTLGPEYRRLLDALYEADPDSKDVQDILAMLAMLDQSCPE